ncbi:UNVERIFIED_CONTAM: hypothetical protein FKN15_011715 [Acipenser sinensis]
MRCFYCGEQGHQRKACPRREARAETGQEQGNAGGEEVGVVGGEREEESAPASQPQPEPVRTKEEAIQSRKETGADPPTPRPRTKRVSQSLSQTGLELNTAITENGEEPFRDVVKKKRFKQKAAELPDGRAQQVQSSEPAVTGRLQAPSGAPVPHNAGEKNTVEGEPSAVQDSPLAESQSPETVLAGEQEEAAEAGTKELEGAAEELTLRGEQEDSTDEMGEELSDSSLISDIPDSQPASKKKLYTLEQACDESDRQVDHATGDYKVKPECVLENNQKMGSVDKSDMQISFVDCARKSLKWYKKLFFHLLNMAVLNAFILHKTASKKTVTFSKFRHNLISYLVEKYHTPRKSSSGGRPSSYKLTRLTNRHFPNPIHQRAKVKGQSYTAQVSRL